MREQDRTQTELSDRRQAERRIAEEWSARPLDEDRRHVERRSGIERRVLGERREAALVRAASLDQPVPVPAVAAINGHPIHPMLVPLPIGLLVGTLASDLAYLATRDPFWARAALALNGAGVATGIAAATAGAIDFLGRERIRANSTAWLHAAGNATALTLSTIALAARSRDPERAAASTGVALSLATGLILTVTGWLGGELVFRHRIGLAVEHDE